APRTSRGRQAARARYSPLPAARLSGPSAPSAGGLSVPGRCHCRRNSQGPWLRPLGGGGWHGHDRGGVTCGPDVVLGCLVGLAHGAFGEDAAHRACRGGREPYHGAPSALLLTFLVQMRARSAGSVPGASEYIHRTVWPHATWSTARRPSSCSSCSVRSTVVLGTCTRSTTSGVNESG